MRRVHNGPITKNGVLPASSYFIFSAIRFMNLARRFQPGSTFYKCQCLAHSIFILQCIILFVLLNFLFIIFICSITFRAKTFFTSCKCLSISECSVIKLLSVQETFRSDYLSKKYFWEIPWVQRHTQMSHVQCFWKLSPQNHEIL